MRKQGSLGKQKPSCLICAHKDTEFLFRKGKRDFFKCSKDGLVFVYPQPTKRQLYHLYNDRYFESEEFRGNACVGYFAYIRERPLLLEYFDKKINLIKKYVKKGKILDVGCGHGFFLEACEKRKLDAIGIDISEYAIEYAKKHGRNVKLTNIYDAKFKENRFDAAAGFQLIEHLADPLRLVKEVHRILKPGGFVFLTTPNHGGYLRKLMGENWFSYRHQEHLLFFCYESMRNLLEKAGFSKIEFIKDNTRYYPMGHILGAVKYYFKFNSLKKIADFIARILDKMKLLDIKIPFPLDCFVVIAQKPKE